MFHVLKRCAVLVSCLRLQRYDFQKRLLYDRGEIGIRWGIKLENSVLWLAQILIDEQRLAHGEGLRQPFVALSSQGFKQRRAVVYDSHQLVKCLVFRLLRKVELGKLEFFVYLDFHIVLTFMNRGNNT